MSLTSVPSRAEQGRANALFLDLDGTILDLAARPECVVVEPSLPRTLRRLRHQLGGALALVSGRTIASIDELFAGDSFDAIGVHGAEWRCRDGRASIDADVERRLRVEVTRLRESIGTRTGLIVEDKAGSVAVHFRGAPDREAEVENLVSACRGRLGDGFRIQRGKFVCEVMQAGVDKGSAVKLFLGMSPYRGRRPVFAGDDKTDASAMLAVRAAGGIAIGVGPGRSMCADLHIAGPADLRTALHGWTIDGRYPFHAGGLVSNEHA